MMTKSGKVNEYIVYFNKTGVRKIVNFSERYKCLMYSIDRKVEREEELWQ